MATVRDLIRGSMRLVGAIATGETASADEQLDGFNALNDMVDSWSTEGLIVYASTRESFPLTAGVSTYSMGPAATFNTARALRIENAGIEIPGTTPFERQIRVITVDEWAAVPNKTIVSSIPTMLYPEGTYPNDTLHVFPVPNTSYNLILYTWKALSKFANVNASVTFPEGYARALRYNLAIELAPEYGKSASPEVIQIASDSKENIKRMNVLPVYLGCDDAVATRRAGFNWQTGE